MGRDVARAGAWVIGLLTVVLGTVGGCERRASPPPPHTSPAPPPDSKWSRPAWVALADALVASPNIRTPESRARFEELLTSEAWLPLTAEEFDLHWREFATFYPAFQRLQAWVDQQSAADELLRLQLFGIEVGGFGATSLIQHYLHMAKDDPERPARREVIEAVRLSVAQMVCAALYTSVRGNAAARGPMVEALVATLTTYSREGLQLILATLDEQIIPKVQIDQRAPYATFRAALADAFAKTPVTETTTVYQGVGLPLPLGAPPAQVISRSGGFSVDTTPAALVRRVDEAGPDGTRAVFHEIASREGAMELVVLCHDAGFEEVLLGQLQARIPSLTRRGMNLPGTWMTSSTPAREIRVRAATIGPRGCLATVSAPPDGFDAARADDFLASLRPAP